MNCLINLLIIASLSSQVIAMDAAQWAQNLESDLRIKFEENAQRECASQMQNEQKLAYFEYLKIKIQNSEPIHADSISVVVEEILSNTHEIDSLRVAISLYLKLLDGGFIDCETRISADELGIEQSLLKLSLLRVTKPVKELEYYNAIKLRLIAIVDLLLTMSIKDQELKLIASLADFIIVETNHREIIQNQKMFDSLWTAYIGLFGSPHILLLIEQMKQESMYSAKLLAKVKSATFDALGQKLDECKPIPCQFIHFVIGEVENNWHQREHFKVAGELYLRLFEKGLINSIQARRVAELINGEILSIKPERNIDYLEHFYNQIISPPLVYESIDFSTAIEGAPLKKKRHNHCLIF